MERKELNDTLPDICAGKLVFFLTHGFPPHPAGSSVINRNLLANFSRSSYRVLACRANLKGDRIETGSKFPISYIFRYFNYPYRLNKLFYSFQIRFGTLKTILLAKIYKPACIIVVYPDYAFVKMARDAAKFLKLPLVVYFHDTLAESLSGSRMERKAKKLQDQVFKEAARILVMSEGMRELYQRKYELDSVSLEHSYPEKIPSAPPSENALQQGFWGGNIYSINTNAMIRLSRAFGQNDTDLFVATNNGREVLRGMGIIGDHIKTGFFPKRSEYLGYLTQNSVLLLGIDWPDESPVHEDELATIFPTKAPEYLASGRTILVHCPEHYFLAQFFKKYKCGVVVSTPDEDAIADVLKEIMNNPGKFREMNENALKAAQLFKTERLTDIFQKEVAKVIH